MDNLRIVMMNGGLGNQMFQYTFMRYIEIMTNTKCLVDDSAFFGTHVEHNGYELEKVFHIQLNLLSNFFSEDVWNDMIAKKENGISIPQQLKDNGLDIMVLADATDYSFEGNSVFFSPADVNQGVIRAFASAEGCIYYHGYFVNTLFFKEISSIIRNEFTFLPITNTLDIDTINRRYMDLICLTNSVALHIRRGDFVQCGRAVSEDKYRKAISLFEEKYNNCTYFVFSDDMKWCKEKQEELGIAAIRGDVFFVEENNEDNKNYIDMQLMTKCKKMIISNSSFGWWAYLLNTEKDLEIIQVNKL